MQSGYEFVSPPRARRHGGARSGAGRKSKDTPEKKDTRNVRQNRSRRQLRYDFEKWGKRLLRYVSRSYVGPKYVKAHEEYLRLSVLLGTRKGLVNVPAPARLSGEDEGGEGSVVFSSSASDEDDSEGSSSSTQSQVKIYCV